MRNEKNPDASRMVFPGMLDGVGINPMVAKRFGIQNESQLLDMASTGRELLREYNDALLCAGIAMSRAEIKTKNRIDLRACVPTKSTKGKQMRRTVSRILTGNALRVNSCIAITGTAISRVFQKVPCSLIQTGMCTGRLQRLTLQRVPWMCLSAITTG